MKINLKQNNRDWLRLILACQVMLVYTFSPVFSNRPHVVLDELLAYIPGVPAFFLSGFLIYVFNQKSRNTYNYFLTRIDRLCPGLILVTNGGLLLAILGWFLVEKSALAFKKSSIRR